MEMLSPASGICNKSDILFRTRSFLLMLLVFLIAGVSVTASVFSGRTTIYVPEEANTSGAVQVEMIHGVGSAARDAAKGLGQLAMNLDPATNAWQGLAGKQTGYQRIAAGAQQAYHGFVQSAENMGTNAQMSGRTMTQSVLDAAANHVDAATKDPNKAGRLAFGTVTTLATGADAALSLYSKAGSATVATARGTQTVAKTEVQATITSESGGAALTFEYQANSGALAGGGAKVGNLSFEQITRIQKTANKRLLEISVVGSRAADAASDWEFILKGGNSRSRHSAMRELPSNPNANKGGDFRPGSEELRGVEVDPERPNIKFKPQNE